LGVKPFHCEEEKSIGDFFKKYLSLIFILKNGFKTKKQAQSLLYQN
jgi:hypothetical protein